jgi:ABC-2 type transport system permease protein
LSRPSALRIFVKTVLARAYPRVIGHARNRAWIFMEIALPLIGTIAMVYVYRALRAPAQYTGFVVLGGTVLAFWQNILFDMAGNFIWERGGSNLELFTVAPTTFTAILLGMALGGIFYTAQRAAVVLLATSLLFHVQYRPAGIAPAVGLLVLTLLALYALGMLLASLFLFFGRAAWHALDGMQEPVYFLSGFYFPVHSLGAYVAGAASIIPLTLGLDAIRQVLLPGTPVFLAPGWEAALIALQIPVYLLGAQWALRVMERLARRDARLSMRWV